MNEVLYLLPSLGPNAPPTQMVDLVYFYGISFAEETIVYVSVCVCVQLSYSRS